MTIVTHSFNTIGYTHYAVRRYTRNVCMHVCMCVFAREGVGGIIREVVWLCGCAVSKYYLMSNEISLLRRKPYAFHVCVGRATDSNQPMIRPGRSCDTPR